ncbi:hypothetical protein F5878DRAFT_667303 [Lentinula raphanica]|uniref:Uncharacterized protein n=1 Tax=Lentinula raphanica TaxID=153919 RepID=A0AA38NW78_9AGAR|nr:hypothetical protein F5878DRAFT_667303 [Lentinula raphanica]
MVIDPITIQQQWNPDSSFTFNQHADATLTTYADHDIPHRLFFFNMFGCTKTLYRISHEEDTKQVAFITPSSAQQGSYENMMFDCQLQSLKDIQLNENLPDSLQHPSHFASTFFPNYNIKSYYINSMIYEYPWCPHIKVDIESDSTIFSPLTSTMLQSNSAVNRYLMFRCSLMREDKIVHGYTHRVALHHMRQSPTLENHNVEDI